MTKEEYENNKENMKPWICETGHVYMALQNSCFFCERSGIFVDYTHGPYMVLCDLSYNTERGLLGQCENFKEMQAQR